MRAIRAESGFTFFEVLIVCVVLGILAAIAIPTFLGKDQLAIDAEAKSNARNLLSEVQPCFAHNEDYTLCDERSELDDDIGLPWGSGAGEVEVLRGGGDTTRRQVTIRAYSKTETGGVRHEFTLVKRTDEPERRECTTGGSDSAGGCNEGSW